MSSTTLGTDLDPVHFGPTWERASNGQFILPTYTIGWDALAWADQYLLQSDGPSAGQRWSPTAEQIRILLWWYAVDDQGNFVYRRGVLRRMKGWGKDPFLAVIAAIEMLGPCRFSHWDSDGNPVGRAEPAAWVQIVAVAQAQTVNTMKVFPGLFSPLCIAKYGLEIGKEQIQAGGGRVIQAVTSSPRVLEGGRPTLVIMNETHHWVQAVGGDELGQVAERNTAKRPGGTARTIQITNAHVPGENSWAEGTYDSMQDIITGRSAGSGIFYDSLESNPEIDIYATDLPSGTEEEKDLRRVEIKNRVELCLLHARGDSVWLNIPRLIEEILDSQTPIEKARRFYFNQIVASEDAWITKQQWDATTLFDKDIEIGDEIVLGFDGSKTRDSTALVAMRVKDGLFKAIRIWERPKPPHDVDWEVPKDQVDDMVEWAFSSYKVVAFYSDVKEWESFVEAWSIRYRDTLKVKASPNSTVAWDMRARLNQITMATESLNGHIIDGSIKHVHNRILENHFLNARRRPNKYGISFGKESKESPRKVDAVAATILAYMARHDYLNKGKEEKKRYGFAW